jgi:hypothetical protein
VSILFSTVCRTLAISSVLVAGLNTTVWAEDPPLTSKQAAFMERCEAALLEDPPQTLLAIMAKAEGCQALLQRQSGGAS